MSINRQSMRPLDVTRSRRRHMVRALTSLPAGRVVPLAAVPLLREDGCSGRMRISFEMMETAEVLMNAVYVNVKAYLIPWLAMERFQGSRDIMDRSYKGVAPMTGEAVIPFVETAVKGAHGTEAIYKYLGLHAKPTTNVNTMIAEAYNCMWNFRAANRSPNITPRARLDYTLAPAFWRHENFAHIVPDFDQAVIDGEVALNVVNAQMPVTGIGVDGNAARDVTAYATIRETKAGTVSYASNASSSDWTGGTNQFHIKTDGLADGTWRPQIFAELQDNGITVSLSNIELARKTQAFARMREQYVELDDEYLIDMLMDGITIPDASLKQPMLLADRTTVFGMSKRYATDAANLAEAAVNGLSIADLSVRVPRIGTGGIIMVTAEITPEQLFERQKDPFFTLAAATDLPEYLRDFLDPEKVEVVTNDYVDTAHATPTGTFGYAPLNHKWNRVQYNIGGKFYRPEVNTGTDSDRQRLWSVETVNPVLSADFYLCTTMHQKPFLDLVSDPFEAVTIGDFVIEGNTVFGGVLVEAQNNYDEVMAKAPTDRIVLP